MSSLISTKPTSDSDTEHDGEYETVIVNADENPESQCAIANAVFETEAFTPEQHAILRMFYDQIQQVKEDCSKVQEDCSKNDQLLQNVTYENRRMNDDLECVAIDMQRLEDDFDEKVNEIISKRRRELWDETKDLVVNQCRDGIFNGYFRRELIEEMRFTRTQLKQELKKEFQEPLAKLVSEKIDEKQILKSIREDIFGEFKEQLLVDLHRIFVCRKELHPTIIGHVEAQTSEFKTQISKFKTRITEVDRHCIDERQNLRNMVSKVNAQLLENENGITLDIRAIEAKIDAVLAEQREKDQENQVSSTSSKKRKMEDVATQQMDHILELIELDDCTQMVHTSTILRELGNNFYDEWNHKLYRTLSGPTAMVRDLISVIRLFRARHLRCDASHCCVVKKKQEQETTQMSE